ncbi:hypothetical protein HYV49_02315 [Candidatus Pacearchaeota archaeon]|nr:hypothetical protein [Candidatus Pacearchaeota archaeon]
MEDIIQEKISADHLLYVSLKYTKTGDVIINLILRWKSIINRCFDALLADAKKRKKIKEIPTIPKHRIEILKEMFKDNENVTKVIEVYEFFNKIQGLDKNVEHEYRKNLTLNVFYNGQWIAINMDKLKEYNALLESFISFVKQSF